MQEEVCSGGERTRVGGVVAVAKVEEAERAVGRAVQAASRSDRRRTGVAPPPAPSRR
ncbi:protein of unknown function [Kyrpidia spormannii]|uniref:Uncharacterized protein n=2 Tax=Kyrpidia spormannii TaxID=2055160 RepID=A0ACA8Z6K6_9BACL|nr:protein of unknown function [Kyrpidia spormannii]CAB3390780.1 protein of unknown function [Kyrpidia spormannii]